MKFSFTSITYKNPIELKPDDKGYYEIIGGAIGLDNEAGEHYIASERVKALFSDDSRLALMVRRGYLKGEVGHPEAPEEMASPNKQIAEAAKKKYFKRLAYIDPLNTCLIIGGIRSVERKNKDGSTYYEIRLKVKPFGKHADVFKAAIEESTDNLALSIRTISKMYLSGGKIVKEILVVFTWDFVPAPGIKDANKYTSVTGASLETLDLGTIDTETMTKEEVKRCIDGVCSSVEESDMIKNIIISEMEKEKINIDW